MGMIQKPQYAAPKPSGVPNPSKKKKKTAKSQIQDALSRMTSGSPGGGY
jgi:hypothetical protein